MLETNAPNIVSNSCFHFSPQTLTFRHNRFPRLGKITLFKAKKEKTQCYRRQVGNTSNKTQTGLQHSSFLVFDLLCTNRVLGLYIPPPVHFAVLISHQRVFNLDRNGVSDFGRARPVTGVRIGAGFSAREWGCNRSPRTVPVLGRVGGYLCV